MNLDLAMYANRLLDWLYDEQASLVRQKEQQSRSRDQALMQQLQARHSEGDARMVFEALTAGILGDRESEQDYVDVGSFLKPLGVTADDGYNIVSYLAEPKFVKTSADRIIGANLSQTLFYPPGEEPPRLEHYDRIIITEVGIREVEAKRLGWHEVTPLATPLAERLLLWLGSLGNSFTTPAYLANFLASPHGCITGRPLFTAAALQAAVRHLLNIGFLTGYADSSSPDNPTGVRLTRKGQECVLQSHGNVEAYLGHAAGHDQGGSRRPAHALTFVSVNERGWGSTPSEIRLTQLLEWIDEQGAGHPGLFVEIKDFYDGRFDQSENDFIVARGDLVSLGDAGLINDASGMGGIESMAAMLAPRGHDFLEQLRAKQANKTQRRTACRDAIVAWLYALDAVDPMRRVDRARILRNPRYGMWLAAPFTSDDLGEAGAWLYDHHLVDGLGSDQTIGPLQLYLTGAGITCAEHFDSDTRRYEEHRMGLRSDPTVNYNGPVIHGNADGAQLAWNNGTVSQSQSGEPHQITEGFEALAALITAILRQLPETGLDSEDQAIAVEAGNEILVEITQPEPESGKIKRAAATLSGVLAQLALAAETGAGQAVTEWAKEAVKHLGKLIS